MRKRNRKTWGGEGGITTFNFHSPGSLFCSPLLPLITHIGVISPSQGPGSGDLWSLIPFQSTIHTIPRWYLTPLAFSVPKGNTCIILPSNQFHIKNKHRHNGGILDDRKSPNLQLPKLSFRSLYSRIVPCTKPNNTMPTSTLKNVHTFYLNYNKFWSISSGSPYNFILLAFLSLILLWHTVKAKWSIFIWAD